MPAAEDVFGTIAGAALSPLVGGATWTSYTLDPATGEVCPRRESGTRFCDRRTRGGGSVDRLRGRARRKSGAYKRHFKLVPKDWHDWDASNAPAVVRTRSGKRLLAVTPKDGHLYGFDLETNALLYRMPVTRIENADVPFSAAKAVHFCPGSVGGAEWNGPAYDPRTNLILIGEVDWCATVRLQTDAQIQAVEFGHPWSAMASDNPYNTWGVMDPHRQWAGWVYASDADTGAWKWRAKSNYPIQIGMTATAGGAVFFGRHAR